MVTLRIGHDLPAPTLVLEHVEFYCNGLLPRGHLWRLQSLAIALRTRYMHAWLVKIADTRPLRSPRLEVESNSDTKLVLSGPLQ